MPYFGYSLSCQCIFASFPVVFLMLNNAAMNVSVCFLGIQPREALTHVLLEIINKKCVFLCVSVCLCISVYACMHD